MHRFQRSRITLVVEFLVKENSMPTYFSVFSAWYDTWWVKISRADNLDRRMLSLRQPNQTIIQYCMFQNCMTFVGIECNQKFHKCPFISSTMCGPTLGPLFHYQRWQTIIYLGDFAYLTLSSLKCRFWVNVKMCS